MPQIFIIILFRISSKNVSLCSKFTDSFHYSQLYWRILQFFPLLQSKSLKIFYSLCILLRETVTAYQNSCYCSKVLSN